MVNLFKTTRLKGYIYSQLTSSFFQIFFVLFAITSIIYLVRIAALTSVIEVNVYELFMLYLYSVPNIIFYTLPIVFVVSLAIAISKLSSEYETIVLTSFGLSPYDIIKVFLPLTLLVTATLLIISLGLVPKTKDLNRIFIENKKNDAKLNIKASQNGQKFGDWLVYIKDENDEIFYDITLFKKDQNSKEFIKSLSANTERLNEELSFKLNNGKAFIIKDDINQVNFEKLILLKYQEADSSTDSIDNPIDYWLRIMYKPVLISKDTESIIAYYHTISQSEKIKKEFAISVLMSIFPMISILSVIFIGYYNPRYEKSNAVSLAAFSVTIFIVLIVSLNKYIPLESIILIPLIWIGISYILFKKYVLSRY